MPAWVWQSRIELKRGDCSRLMLGRREQRRKSLVDELASLCAQAYGILFASSIRPMSNEESADYRRCRERIGQICEILETVEPRRFPESSSA